MKLKVRNLNSACGVAYAQDCLRAVNVHDARIDADVIVFPTRMSELQVRELRRQLGGDGFATAAVWGGPQAA